MCGVVQEMPGLERVRLCLEAWSVSPSRWELLAYIVLCSSETRPGTFTETSSASIDGCGEVRCLTRTTSLGEQPRRRGLQTLSGTEVRELSLRVHEAKAACMLEAPGAQVIIDETSSSRIAASDVDCRRQGPDKVCESVILIARPPRLVSHEIATWHSSVYETGFVSPSGQSFRRDAPSSSYTGQRLGAGVRLHSVTCGCEGQARPLRGHVGRYMLLEQSSAEYR